MTIEFRSFGLAFLLFYMCIVIPLWMWIISNGMWINKRVDRFGCISKKRVSSDRCKKISFCCEIKFNESFDALAKSIYLYEMEMGMIATKGLHKIFWTYPLFLPSDVICQKKNKNSVFLCSLLLWIYANESICKTVCIAYKTEQIMAIFHSNFYSRLPLTCIIFFFLLFILVGLLPRRFLYYLMKH